MLLTRSLWVLLLTAVCSGRRIHRPSHGSQQVLLIDLPDEREVDSAKTVEDLSQPAADGRARSQDQTAETAQTVAVETVAVEKEETEGAAGRTEEGGEVAAVEETVEEMKEETVEEAEEETVEEVDEETEEVEHKVEQRPPRIVKRQCYGCAEVVCSCPNCDRR